jgi:hypothetical protein
MIERPSIFVSAVSSEFRSFRQAVREVLLTRGIFPIVQDNFPPDYRHVRAMLADRISEADAVICLVGFAYGAEPHSRPGGEARRSYTQIEYQIARELGKPIFVFLSDEKVRPCDGPPDEDVERCALQIAHRGAIMAGDELWNPFKARDELEKLTAEIPVVASVAFRISSGRLRHGADSLVGREKELARLDAAWHDPKTHVVTIVAWGGVGKTALVVEWMARMARDGWPGAERVFDWSFNRQGTRETTTASSDPFVAKALEFFGDSEMAKSAASSWDKGERLARLAAEHKTLLVLDGVEPLQYPPGSKGGQLKDPALEALLKGLAQNNHGLCIVSTREPLTDLDAWMAKTLVYLGELEYPKDRHPRLCRLSTEAGAQVLFQAGVRKAGNADIEAGDEELKDAAREVDGHALTLNLLGHYLADAHGGDIRRRDRVRFEKADARVQGGHAFRMMATYEKWLGKAGEDGKRQLAALRLLGLFDRPADPGCLAALRTDPVLDGLTKPLIGLDDEDWRHTVSNLGKCGFVSVHTDESADGNAQLIVDAHPLVREYFGTQLRKKRPKAWRAGHQRLYEYLSRKGTSDEAESTFDNLERLCQAVTHACQAGCFDEAWQLYQTRISGGERQNPLTRVWGAVTLDRAVLRSFFDSADHLMLKKEDADARLDLRYQLGTDLTAMREVDDAKKCFEAMKKEALGTKPENYGKAADACGNLSQEALLRCSFNEALREAEESVEYAHKSKSAFHRLRRVSTLATVLHYVGQRGEARSKFLEADRIVPQWRDEEREKGRERPETNLWGVMGYNFCDLLLDEKRHAEVMDRARHCLAWAEEKKEEHRVKLDIGLARLSVARAEVQKLEEEHGQVPQSLLCEFNEAVRKLTDTGRQEEICRGLLARAEACSLAGDADGCKADLKKTLEIAERGGMKLHMVDALLCQARLLRDKAALVEARKLIDGRGYPRRGKELDDA